VKIQYPNIRDAIAGDVAWFRAVSRPAQLSRHFPSTLIDELETQLVAETDYRREAENLAFLGKALRVLPWVEVPRVVARHSTDTVLTMSLVAGEHLDAFLAARPSQRLRDLVGERLFELFYFQVLRVEAFHADPHWGNYLFRRDGTIGLVDFGSVKYLPADFVENLRRVFLYAGDREADAFVDLLRQRYVPAGLRLTAAARRALIGFSERFYRAVYPPEPEAEARTFDFGDAAFLRAYMRETTNVMRARGVLPEYVYFSRAELGLYQTLHRLRARVHTSRIVRRYLTPPR
jgi:predicted unusual protein kinase regulating ubiquinone biosynthesis (AarF/ABC1/UbiB family)